MTWKRIRLSPDCFSWEFVLLQVYLCRVIFIEVVHRPDLNPNAIDRAPIELELGCTRCHEKSCGSSEDLFKDQS